MRWRKLTQTQITFMHSTKHTEEEEEEVLRSSLDVPMCLATEERLKETKSRGWVTKGGVDEGSTSWSCSVFQFHYFSNLVCLNSPPCGLPVGPCEHGEAAAGEGSHSRLTGCHEAHAAVSCLWDGIQRCHTHAHKRWVLVRSVSRV